MIREKLIHLLGGVTKVEEKQAYNYGIFVSARDLKELADSMYGKSADEWCNAMYERIDTQLADYGKTQY